MTFLLLCALPPAVATEGLSADEIGLINEAVIQIRTHALVPPKSPPGIIADMLRLYAQSLDEYSDYLTSREYAAFQESTNSDYFGVQMDIRKQEERIHLFPFKDGIAEKSGIKAGDELMAVNGVPVYGKSVFLVGSYIRGAQDVTVQLTIRSGQGIPRVLTLRRQRTDYLSVTSQQFNEAHYIRITRFAKNTEKLLRAILVSHGEDKRTILLDLRQNQGGSLRVARQCADLFLDAGAVLFRLRFRDEAKDIVAEQPPVTTSELILLQDQNTASAAEAFIAALTGNGRAISVGRKSYGKSLAQRFLPLADGSALRLTYAEILTPDNFAYNKKGLEPGLKLPDELADEDFSREGSLTKMLNFINMYKK